MKQHQKDKYPIELCPVCRNPFDECTCENLYPEQDLIDQDDENIEDAFNVY